MIGERGAAGDGERRQDNKYKQILTSPSPTMVPSRRQHDPGLNTLLDTELTSEVNWRDYMLI